MEQTSMAASIGSCLLNIEKVLVGRFYLIAAYLQGWGIVLCDGCMYRPTESTINSEWQPANGRHQNSTSSTTIWPQQFLHRDIPPHLA